MKNNLKNRMDHISQDFDRDALWNRIEQPNKRKRKLAWIFLGSTILGLLLVTLLFYGSKSNQSLIPLEISNEVILLNTSKLKDNHAENVNQLDNKVVFKSSNDITINESNHHLINDNNYHNSTNNHSNINKLKVQSQLQIKSQIRNQENLIKMQAIDNSKINEHDYSQPAFSTNNRINNHTFNKQIVQINSIELLTLPTIIINSCQSSIEDYELLTNQIITSESPFKRHNIYIYAGLGQDNHQFSNNPLGTYRNYFENSLENLSFGLHYNYKLNQHIFLASTLGFTQSQTNLKRSTKNTTWQSLGGQAINEVTSSTMYDLYNQYYRLDLSLQLGYILKIYDSWSLKPVIGFGINLHSLQNGEIWDTNLDLVNLRTRSEYKNKTGIYGSFGLQIEKSWVKGYVVGLNLEMQTTRNLVSKTNYTHQITPINAKIYIGKSF